MVKAIIECVLMVVGAAMGVGLFFGISIGTVIYTIKLFGL